MSEVPSTSREALGRTRSASLRVAPEAVFARWTRTYGAGSRRELAARFDAEFSRVNDDAAALANEVAARVEHEHRARYGALALAAEAHDERERDAAVTNDAALVRYARKWERRLEKLLRAHPERWRLSGISDGELRDELGLRLIEALRTRSERLHEHQRAGREWGLGFLSHERRRLRASFRLSVVLAEVSPALDRAPTEEERMIALETEGLFALARERAESSLSRPQRRWLSALTLSARSGAFFESSGRPNLAAASRLLDKHRSSAVRAFDELQQHFGRELEKLGG
jgi:hypothetical protein